MLLLRVGVDIAGVDRLFAVGRCGLLLHPLLLLHEHDVGQRDVDSLARAAAAAAH
jgi:hypothetical protein